MGLDMYLNAKRYLWRTQEEDGKIAKNISNIGIGNSEMRVKEITCEAMYWRKANAIHYWFVQNVQSGVDDCREYYVTRKQLESLLGVCNEVLSDFRKADDLLPPAEGFFFGSTKIDDWYFDDIKSTIGMIERLLKNTSDEWEFYYASSW
jgi:hypothetical protein